MSKKNSEIIISTLNNEMNRFWTRFNIFAAVQVGTVIGVISNIEFLCSNLIIFRFVFILFISFSVVGAVAIFRGFDLQKALVKTLIQVEKDLPANFQLFRIMHSHMKFPLYISNIACSIFATLYCLFWIFGWIYCEVIKFSINIPK